MSDLSDYRHPTWARELIASLVPIVCPKDQATRLNVTDDVIDEVELGIRSMPLLVRQALIAGMLTYDNTARLHPLNRGRRAAHLPYDRAQAWFEFWAHGTALQKNFIKGIKGLVGLSFYEHPAVMEDIGYTPRQWIDKVAKRRLEVYRDDIDKHEASIFERDPIPLPSEVGARTTGSTVLTDKKEAS